MIVCKCNLWTHGIPCTVNNQSEVTLLWEDIMRRCGAIYPELFTSHEPLPSSASDAKEVKTLPKPAQQQATLPMSVKVVIRGRTGILNLGKIRSDLVSSSLHIPHQNTRRLISRRRKIILIQALRWVTAI